MAKDIKSILAKKTWTGDDVGRAIILSLIHSYKDTLAGQPETTLFSAAKLKTMVASLKTKEQVTRYNRYVGLNHWISINQPIAMNHQQRLVSEIERLMSITTTQIAVEDALRAFAQLPEIMTQRQYDDRVRAGDVPAGGVAILGPDSPGVDPETGCYAYPEQADDPLAALGVGSLTPADGGYRQHIADVQAARETIADAYYYVQGFNEAVRMIAEAIDIPDFTIFSLNTAVEDLSLLGLDQFLRALPLYIAETPYRDEAAKEQKLAACRDYLQPIDLTRLTIPEAAKAAARAMLEDNLRAFETQDGVFTRTLCIRSEEG